MDYACYSNASARALFICAESGLRPLLAVVFVFVVRGVAAQSASPCDPHPALRHVAVELSRGSAPPSASVLRDAVSKLSLVLPGVRVLFVENDEPRIIEFLNTMQSQSDLPAYCERIDHEQGSLVLAAPQLGSLQPIDPKSPVIRGHLAAGLTHPSVVIAMPSHRFLRFGLTRAELEQGVALEFEVEPQARVQLLAQGPGGPRPIAMTVVGNVGLKPLITGLPTPGPGASGVVTWLRAQAKRPALRRNRLLRDAANRHACHVCRSGELTHVVAGDDPPARIQEQGLVARRIGEVVARGQDEKAAFFALVDSPSHLMTLLERDFTDVGVGLAHDHQGRACVVVMLATFPRFIGRPSSSPRDRRRE